MSATTGKMVRTEICNHTSGELTLKVGNAGVYRDIRKLTRQGEKEKHAIPIDVNATYQEYILSAGGVTDNPTEDTEEIVRFLAEGQDAIGEKLNMVHAQVEGLNSYLRRDRRGRKSELLMFIMVLLQAAILVHTVVSAA